MVEGCRLLIATYPYKYEPTEGGDVIEINTGDIFILLQKTNEEWWLVAQLADADNEFFVPANYVDELPRSHEAYSSFNHIQDNANSLDSALEDLADLKVDGLDSFGFSCEEFSKENGFQRNTFAKDDHNRLDEHTATPTGGHKPNFLNLWDPRKIRRENSSPSTPSANTPDSTSSAHRPAHHRMRSDTASTRGPITSRNDSFRKSLDDLISPTPLGDSAASVMSSTFSISTLSDFPNIPKTLFPAEACTSSDNLCDSLLTSPGISLSKDVLKEGALIKKMEHENASFSRNLLAGRSRSGKYWVQLTECSLLFYKEQKFSSSSSVAQSKPEHSFELLAAQLEWRRGKKNTFQLWNDFIPGTKILLKSGNPYDAARWFDAIHNVIMNLRSGVTDIENDADFDTLSTMTPVPSAAAPRKTQPLLAPGGGGYSGTDTFTVRNCLASLLSRRPSVDMLEKKGILKPEPVFGCMLELRCLKEGGRLVPRFVQHAISEVERRGLDIEGIYRVCGNMSDIQRLRFAVDQDPDHDLRSVSDIHVITGALKMYLRELPESLFPTSSYSPLAAALQLPDADMRLRAVREIVATFPACNRATIHTLFSHLLLIYGNQPLNKMDVTNLAIVFGPNVIFPPLSVSMASSVAVTNGVISFALANLHAILPAPPPPAPPSAAAAASAAAAFSQGNFADLL